MRKLCGRTKNLRASSLSGGVFGLVSVVLAILLASIETTRSASGADALPVVYLTFDDGPAVDNGTLLVLDVLAKHNVQATFFIVGENVVRKPEQVRAMVDGGHTIASHSYSHADLTSLDAAGVRSELARTQDAVAALGVPAPSCYRPPWGRSNDEVRGVTSALGLAEIIWSFDSEDWKRQGVDVLKSRLDLIGPGENVLLHDGYLKGAETAEAVDHFLSRHRTEYDFRIVPECVTGGDLSVTVPTAVTVPTTVAPRSETPALEPSTVQNPLGPVLHGPADSHCRSGPDGPLFGSSDVTSGAIYRMYCSFFGRRPDRAGFEYWYSVWGQSVSASQASSHFLAGVEFSQTYGDLEDEDFLDVVYLNVLGRVPDSEGRAFWLDLLEVAGTPREAVMLEFSESPEFRTTTGTG